MDFTVTSMRGFAAWVLAGTNSPPHVVVGPLIFDDDDDFEWLLPVAVGDRQGFNCGRILLGPDRDKAAEERRILLAELARVPAITTHDAADELEMVRLYEVIWPGDKSRVIREAVEEDLRHRN